MSSSRLKKCLSLRDSIVTRSKSHSSGNIATNNEDHIFMHILDCIGALSCIRAEQKKEADTNMEREATALLASQQASRLLASRSRNSRSRGRTGRHRPGCKEDIYSKGRFSRLCFGVFPGRCEGIGWSDVAAAALGRDIARHTPLGHPNHLHF